MNRMSKALLENMPFPIWVKDLDLKFIYVNKKYAEIYDKDKEYFIGLKNEDLFSPDTCKIYNKHCQEVIDIKETKTVGRYVYNEFRQCYIFPVLDDNNKELVGIAGIIDLVNLKKIEEKNNEIEFQKNLTKQIIDILPGVIFYKDKNSRYIYANKECTDFYKQRGIDNIIGKSDLELYHSNELAMEFINDDKKIIETKKPIYNETILEGKNGIKEYREVVKMPLIDNMGNVSGIVGRSVNITEKKLVEERLRYLSYTDILTGVNNRTSFEERIMELSKEKYLPLGVIMGDANGLKLINDTLGHEQGDLLLKLSTNVFKEACENMGEIFRIGGDEFVILIPNTSKDKCDRLIDKINEKCKSYKHDLFKLSISLGKSLMYDINKDVYKVVKEAEDEMYRQKKLQEKSINLK